VAVVLRVRTPTTGYKATMLKRWPTDLHNRCQLWHIRELCTITECCAWIGIFGVVWFFINLCKEYLNIATFKILVTLTPDRAEYSDILLPSYVMWSYMLQCINFQFFGAPCKYLSFTENAVWRPQQKNAYHSQS